jgi:transposase InsO family protein
MSRKGNYWDNAAMESFFARLKVEKVYTQKYQNIEEAYSRVFEYIELFTIESDAIQPTIT